MATAPDNTPVDHCLDCGARRVGRWCHECGQPAPRPLRFSRIGQDVLDHLTDLGRSGTLPDTVRRLTTQPGTAIGAWVDGKRGSLVNPVKYAFLMLTGLAISMGVTGIDPGHGLGLEERNTVEQQGLRVANALLAYLAFVSLVVVAFVQRWLFRDRRAVAENYAFQLFISGHLAILTTLAVLAGIMESPLGLGIVTLAALGYTIFALAGFHAARGPGLFVRGLLIHATSVIALNALGLVFVNLAYVLGLLDWLAGLVA